MSGFGLTKVNRINTWLSCEWMCWTSNGAQNVYLRPDKPDEFQIYLYQVEKHTVTTEWAAKYKYALHYEVEGTC